MGAPLDNRMCDGPTASSTRGSGTSVRIRPREAFLQVEVNAVTPEVCLAERVGFELCRLLQNL